MPLSKDEEAALAELERKRDEPEPERKGPDHRLDFKIDLSDEAAVERALSLGLITRAEAEAAEDDLEDDDEDDDGGKPRPKAKPKPKEGEPRRRLTGADRLMGA